MLVVTFFWRFYCDHLLERLCPGDSYCSGVGRDASCSRALIDGHHASSDDLSFH